MPAYSATELRTSLYPMQVGQCFGYLGGKIQAIVITSTSRTTNVVTVTTAAAHPFAIGDVVTLADVVPVGATTFNGSFTVATVPTGVTFTFAQTADNDTGADGTATGSSIFEPMPAINTASTSFAVPDIPYGAGLNGRSVTWNYAPVTAPGAITVVLQGGMTEAEADYVTLDTSTVVGGASRVLAGVHSPYLRLKITALTLTNGAGMRGRIQV